MAIIKVENIVKEYNLIKKERGIFGAVKSICKPEKIKVRAVDDISFKIEPGEIVGYIGPNGAGKSTTIKILTGILHPTSGKAEVCGLSPQHQRKEVVKRLGVVFGQRTQLYWDLRLEESFELIRRLYQIDMQTYRTNLTLMNDILRINDFIHVPVRQLSLGQRMRADLTAAVLHSPPILFLDEPTIGLDIVAKQAIRKFILELNERQGTTIILTTHDIGDVEQLCDRLIVINYGRVIEDGPLQSIIDKLAPYRVLQVDFIKTPVGGFTLPSVEILKQEDSRVWLKFDKNRISASDLVSCISQEHMIRDLSIQEPDIEDVLSEFYKSI